MSKAEHNELEKENLLTIIVNLLATEYAICRILYAKKLNNFHLSPRETENIQLPLYHFFKQKKKTFMQLLPDA